MDKPRVLRHMPARIWNTAEVRSLIWDMGGTLVDTYPEVDRTLAGVVWGDALTPEHLAEVRDLRMKSIDHTMTVLSERYGVDRSALQQAYADLKDRWRVRPAPLMAGATDLMDAVHRAGGLNLIATHRDRQSAQWLLDALGVTVDDFVSTSDGLPRKPDPAMNLALVRRHHLDPAEVLCVGDRAIDVFAADAAHLASALLVTPGAPAEDLRGAHPIVITHLAELIPLFTPAPGSTAPDTPRP